LKEAILPTASKATKLTKLKSRPDTNIRKISRRLTNDLFKALDPTGKAYQIILIPMRVE